MIKSITDVITNSSTEVYIIQAPTGVDFKWMADLEEKINSLLKTDRPNSWEGIDSIDVLLDKDGHARVTLDEHTKKVQEYLLREQKVLGIWPDSNGLLEDKYNLSKEGKPLSIKEEWIEEEYGEG
ncbi:MAG: hypothetical protein IJ880_08245 [Bacilli bacterium]|nr:hypothetical protein [Bacilli bacterium]